MNVFRALEAWGAALYAQWAAHEEDPALRTGHLVIAEREANHARLLAERLRALGTQARPGLRRRRARAPARRSWAASAASSAQLDALKAANDRDHDAMAGLPRGARPRLRGVEGGRPGDARASGSGSTAKRVSGGWYRATYSMLTGKRPGPVAPPLLSPEQVIRRADSASASA